jgi:cytochrome c-type biogenesis protein CcmE
MTTAPTIGPAASSGPVDGGGRPPGPPRPAAPMRTSHRLRYTVVGLVLVGALAFLLVKGLSSALDFYLPANQAVAEEATLGSRTVNLEGLVAPHTIHATPSGVDFVMTSGATRVQVLNSTSPPQLFQPDIPVIAVGHFSG